MTGIEEFKYENISNKIILASPENPNFDISLLVFHSEAAFALRKHIIEKAQNYWKKELTGVTVNDVLSYTAKKSRTME